MQCDEPRQCNMNDYGIQICHPVEFASPPGVSLIYAAYILVYLAARLGLYDDVPRSAPAAA